MATVLQKETIDYDYQSPKMIRSGVFSEERIEDDMTSVNVCDISTCDEDEEEDMTIEDNATIALDLTIKDNGKVSSFHAGDSLITSSPQRGQIQGVDKEGQQENQEIKTKCDSPQGRAAEVKAKLNAPSSPKLTFCRPWQSDDSSKEKLSSSGDQSESKDEVPSAMYRFYDRVPEQYHPMSEQGHPTLASVSTSHPMTAYTATSPSSHHHLDRKPEGHPMVGQGHPLLTSVSPPHPLVTYPGMPHHHPALTDLWLQLSRGYHGKARHMRTAYPSVPHHPPHHGSMSPHDPLLTPGHPRSRAQNKLVSPERGSDGDSDPATPDSTTKSPNVPLSVHIPDQRSLLPDHVMNHADAHRRRYDATRNSFLGHTNDAKSVSDVTCSIWPFNGRRSRDPSKPASGKKYKCDLCGKSFSRSNTLVTHRRIHTGEKPFECDLCGRAFRQPGNLTRHRMTHTPHKPYVCPVCNKAFNRASNLQTHMRTHDDYVPFVCPYCGQGFQKKTDWKAHCYTHTSVTSQGHHTGTGVSLTA